MLKLFFIIATLTTLAKSEIAVEWICEETYSMGNCSSIPKITDLLQVISDKSDNYEYTDFYYCPHNIVERHAKCMQKYFDSCYTYMTVLQQTLMSVYLPPVENAQALCIKGRPYKKEFREHTTCTKALLKADHQWDHYLENKQIEHGQYIDDMVFSDRCQIVTEFWRSLAVQIRSKCGSKTEKFARQVLGQMWPLSILSICDQLLKFEK